MNGRAGDGPVNAAPTGILLLDKPQGLTSHDVVARARRALGTRKVGHAGTLDPMATGLLILGVGAATRLLTHLVGLDKEYLATIRLGQATTTDDAEGEVLVEEAAGRLETSGAVAGVTDARIAAGVAALTGDILQRPSAVSAIRVDGVRAYDRVRAGEAVELKARPVRIAAFDVLNIHRTEWTDIDVRVECSSGTYIRALARDLGEDLGVGGHLIALRRTRVGPFSIAEALPVPERLALSERHRVEGSQRVEGSDASPVRSSSLSERDLLDPAEVAARLFPKLQLDAQQTMDLRNGKQLAVTAAAAPTVAALAPDGRLVGLVGITDGRARVIVNFPAEQTGQALT